MSDDAMEHEWTEEIVCPYCGDEDPDSWEWNGGEEGDGHTDCKSCGREFYVQRHVLITYSTAVKRP